MHAFLNNKTYQASALVLFGFAVGAALLVFENRESLLAQEQTDSFQSVEFDIAELSPVGEEGGYAMPASGSSGGGGGGCACGVRCGGSDDQCRCRSCPPPNPPNIRLNAVSPVNHGDSTTLSWNVRRAGTPSSCNTTHGAGTSWAAFNTGTSNGSTVIGPLSALDSPITFRLVCSNGDGSHADTATVVVSPPPINRCADNDFDASPLVLRDEGETTVTWQNPTDAHECRLMRGTVEEGYSAPSANACDETHTVTVELMNTTDFRLECTDVVYDYDADYIDEVTVQVYDYDQN